MTSAVLANVDNLFASKKDEGACVRAADGSDGYPDLDKFIDREINVRLTKNVGWKKLEMCFKWKHVMEFLRDRGVAGDAALISRIRTAMTSSDPSGLDDIEYDTHLHRIVKIGLPEVDAIPCALGDGEGQGEHEGEHDGEGQGKGQGEGRVTL